MRILVFGIFLLFQLCFIIFERAGRLSLFDPAVTVQYQGAPRIFEEELQPDAQGNLLFHQEVQEAPAQQPRVLLDPAPEVQFFLLICP